MMRVVLVALFGYLIGSISFGIIVTKLVRGVDIRALGSGNTGFTNVLRVIGKGPAAVVLLGDVFKGIAAVLLGFYLGDTMLAVCGGIAAMIGHNYPLYFGLKGGKGVATGFGVVIALVPDVMAVALAIFVVTVLITRYVSLGSILGALSVPVTSLIFGKPTSVVVFAFFACSMVIFRHKSNIIKLYHGKESKLGEN